MLKFACSTFQQTQSGNSSLLLLSYRLHDVQIDYDCGYKQTRVLSTLSLNNKEHGHIYEHMRSTRNSLNCWQIVRRENNFFFRWKQSVSSHLAVVDPLLERARLVATMRRHVTSDSQLIKLTSFPCLKIDYGRRATQVASRMIY